MLIGDYNSPCKRHEGLCECQWCRERLAKERTKKKHEDWYRRLLFAYMEELQDNPELFTEKAEEAEAFLTELYSAFRRAETV